MFERLTRDLEISISEGTKNMTIVAHGSSVEEVKKLVEYALKEAKKVYEH